LALRPLRELEPLSLVLLGWLYKFSVQAVCRKNCLFRNYFFFLTFLPPAQRLTSRMFARQTPLSDLSTGVRSVQQQSGIKSNGPGGGPRCGTRRHGQDSKETQRGVVERSAALRSSRPVGRGRIPLRSNPAGPCSRPSPVKSTVV
jgi:hypothetical protein